MQKNKMKKIMTEKLKASELGSWCNQKIIKKLKPETFVLLSGNLGVGKTFFVQTVIRLLGGEKVFSPTYSLINNYQTKSFEKVYHVDLYRLKDDEDLESTGFWDLFNDKALVFIEWADRLNLSRLPLEWKKIQIHIQQKEDENNRHYSWSVVHHQAYLEFGANIP